MIVEKKIFPKQLMERHIGLEIITFFVPLLTTISTRHASNRNRIRIPARYQIFSLTCGKIFSDS
jgi:hypothetical protein